MLDCENMAVLKKGDARSTGALLGFAVHSPGLQFGDPR